MRPTKWKLGDIVLLFVSSVVALLLCELGSRLILNPVDYLSPVIVRDDILGIRLPPRSGGHDEWGFRNARVPQTAQLVTLGDSHTYGNTAKMNEAWPHVLGRLIGTSVYNLGIGGYGPNQYYYLLQTKALALKPATVICGLYMGDDFDNAYRITYGLSYWSFLRRGELADKVDPDIWEKGERETKSESWHKPIRNWLSGHSILYRLVVHGLFGGIKGRYQVEHASQIYDSATSLLLPEKHIRESFLPAEVLRGLDQGEPSVREGMRITFELLQKMNALCTSNHIRFIVAVIPTKETVFARYLEHDPKLAMSETLDKLIANERIARQKLFAMFNQENISYIDLLPAMEMASGKGKIYTADAADMHPNKNGYRVIAEAISQYLKTSK